MKGTADPNMTSEKHFCTIPLRISLTRHLVWRGASFLAFLLIRSTTIRTSHVVDAQGAGEHLAKNTEDSLQLKVANALELLEKRDNFEGEIALKTVAEEHQSYAPAHFYLGLLSQTRGELITAVEYYAATLRADAQHADATNNIAAALTALPPLESVRVATGLGLLSPPLTTIELNAMEISRVVAESYARATQAVIEQLYLRALEIDPAHRWAMNNYGLHLHSLGENAEPIIPCSIRERAHRLFNRVRLPGSTKTPKAADMFARAVKQYPRDAELHFHLGIAFESLGKAQEAARSFMAALEHNPQHPGAALNLAALHHRFGDKKDAVDHYRRAADLIPPGERELVAMLRNNLGTALFQLGKYSLAKIEHQAVLDLFESEDDGLPSVDDGGAGYDVYIDTLVNMYRARRASCDWRDWEKQLFNLRRQVDMGQLEYGRPPSVLPFDTLLMTYPADPTWRRKLAEAHSQRYDVPTIPAEEKHYSKKSSFHGGMDEFSGQPCQSGLSTLSGESGESGKTPSPPSGEAVGQASIPPTDEETRQSGGREGRLLEIGFIGHDFDEHPTAHMMEGVFLWQKRLSGGIGGHAPGMEQSVTMTRSNREGAGLESIESSVHRTLDGCCRYSVFSYGGGGGDTGGRRQKHGENITSSRVRESIRSLVPLFVDLFATGHEEAVRRIREERIDILVDLQGHTLGGRSEIVAARPSPIQVNYLVFPGTSGAAYMDYLFADRHVTPPEHADHYSESLVLLPRTYQANLYDDQLTSEAMATLAVSPMDKTAARIFHGLSGDLSRPVLANFNKLDKLDPESFLLWMKILRRVPGCLLWLLDPDAGISERNEIHERLGDEAEALGIERSRIVWAERVPKAEHLLRHSAADLFVDTLTYGAHSTATDALAGGLPLLTLAGDTFASRVGVSLLRNAGEFQRALIVTSRREYEDLAVELISTPRGRRILGELRARLLDGRPLKPSSARGDTEDSSAEKKGSRGGTLPLFDTRAITMDINRAFMAMSDLRDRIGCGETWGNGCDGWRRYPHVFLTQRKEPAGEQDQDGEEGGI